MDFRRRLPEIRWQPRLSPGSETGMARYIGVIPMRGMRWLLLVAIAAILGGVVYQYRAQKRLLARDTPVAPAPLPADLKSSAEHWHYRDTDLKTGRTKSDIDAESFQQVKDDSRANLGNVTLKIYGKDGNTRSEERRVGKECRSRWSPHH